MPCTCTAATDTLASSQGAFRATIIPMDMKGKLSTWSICRKGQRVAGEIVWFMAALALKPQALLEDSQ